jgi:hypothetical protein
MPKMSKVPKMPKIIASYLFILVMINIISVVLYSDFWLLTSVIGERI